ncbi:MAG: hypothetical protein ACI4JS_03360 [Oscillospiraceae bacterium]
MKDFDYGKKPIYLISSILILVGIGFIWRYVAKDRFYPPEEHYGFRGTYYTGGWVTVVWGIVITVFGFVVLFAFG